MYFAQTRRQYVTYCHHIRCTDTVVFEGKDEGAPICCRKRQQVILHHIPAKTGVILSTETGDNSYASYVCATVLVSRITRMDVEEDT
jgi:hypothetical protein